MADVILFNFVAQSFFKPGEGFAVVLIIIAADYFKIIAVLFLERVGNGLFGHNMSETRLHERKQNF